MSKGRSVVRRSLIVGLLLTATASGVPQLVASSGRAATPPPPPPPCVEQVGGCADQSLAAADPAVPVGTAPTVTVPGGTVSTPNGTVTVPGGNVTVPGGNVTVPGGTVSMPGGNVTVPGGTVTVPGGTVTVPGGNVTVPDGNVTVPDGNAGGNGNVVDPGPGTVPGPGAPGGVGGPGQLLWSADFESGDLTGFDDTPWNQVGSGPPRILTLADGTKALGLTIPAGGARNEVVPDIPKLREGDDLYFGFSTFLAEGFPLDARWQVLAQWHNDGNGSPPISLSVQRDRFVLDGGWGHPAGNQHHYQVDLGPAVPGAWNDWVFHIRFSANPSVGFAEVWRDSQAVLGPFSPSGGTLYPGVQSYLKTGYYRDENIRSAGTVVLDDWRIGTTYGVVSGTATGAAVAGALVAPPVATTLVQPPTTTPTVTSTPRTVVTPPPTTTPDKPTTTPTTPPTIPPTIPSTPTTPPEPEPPAPDPDPLPDEEVDGYPDATDDAGTGDAGTGYPEAGVDSGADG